MHLLTWKVNGLKQDAVRMKYTLHVNHPSDVISQEVSMCDSKVCEWGEGDAHDLRDSRKVQPLDMKAEKPTVDLNYLKRIIIIIVQVE